MTARCSATTCCTAGRGGGGKPALGSCWVGLNPSTGDTTGRPRPTLRKVVALAKSHGLSADTLVSLFSWRATRPADLKRAAPTHEVIGERMNDLVVEADGHRSPWGRWDLTARCLVEATRTTPGTRLPRPTECENSVRKRRGYQRGSASWIAGTPTFATWTPSRSSAHCARASPFGLPGGRSVVVETSRRRAANALGWPA